MIRFGRAFVGGVVLFVGGMAHAVAPAVPVAAYIVETGASVIGQFIARDAALGALQTVTTTASTSSGFSSAMTALSTLAGAAFVLDQTFENESGEVQMGFRLDPKTVDFDSEDISDVPLTITIADNIPATTCTPPANLTPAWTCVARQPYAVTHSFDQTGCDAVAAAWVNGRIRYGKSSGSTAPIKVDTYTVTGCTLYSFIQTNGTVSLGYRICTEYASSGVSNGCIYMAAGRAGRSLKYSSNDNLPTGVAVSSGTPQQNTHGAFYISADNLKGVEQYGGRMFPQPFDADYYDFENRDANQIAVWDEEAAFDRERGVERIVFTGTNPQGQKFSIVAHVDEYGLIYDASVEHVPDGATQPSVFEQGAVFKQTGQAYQHVERTHNGVNLQTFFSEYFGNLQEQGTDFGPLLDPAAEPETPEQELPMRASLRPVNETGDETGGGYLSSDGWLGALDLWEPPPHTSQCPVIEFPFFDDVITPGTAHCDLWAQHSEELSNAFMLMWSFLALWIMLGA